MYNAGSSLSALSISPSGQFVVLAGREVLQVVGIDGTLVHNLRHQLQAKPSFNDVIWSGYTI